MAHGMAEIKYYIGGYWVVQTSNVRVFHLFMCDFQEENMSDGGDRVTGKVKWFSDQKGFDFITQMTAERTSSSTIPPSNLMVSRASKKERRTSSSSNLMDLALRPPMWPK
ncbi:hypothetical protein Dsin_028363 [Dipteronia sinensis]|uniref:Uncharacterized protein n=1 Tax=Dipteronia sinensis TaxID=43782 RepID=A0AAE0DVG9_9ROSI|nr:hypothetical protein Dsin_028363 [Dipteronia sinensis]